MGNLIKVANKNDLAPGKAISASVNNKEIAIFNIDGKFYAIDNECTHAGGPLCEGELGGTTVTCPWHGATFDVASGAALGAPAFTGVCSYKVHVEGDEIKVEMP